MPSTTLAPQAPRSPRPLLERIRRRADRDLGLIVALHLPVALALAPLHDTWAEAIVVGGAASLLPLLATRRAPAAHVATLDGAMAEIVEASDAQGRMVSEIHAAADDMRALVARSAEAAADAADAAVELAGQASGQLALVQGFGLGRDDDGGGTGGAIPTASGERRTEAARSGAWRAPRPTPLTVRRVRG